ncbi:MAG: hypothetical protein ACXVCX_01460 [Ktedonobacterales bacterium]
MSSVASSFTISPIPASASPLPYAISLAAKRRSVREAQPGNSSGYNSGNITGNIGNHHNTVHSHPFPNLRRSTTSADHSGHISGNIGKNSGNITGHDSGNITGHDSGNISGHDSGNSGKITHVSPSNTIPDRARLSAIGNHRKKRNRGKNGNGTRMLLHSTRFPPTTRPATISAMLPAMLPAI